METSDVIVLRDSRLGRAVRKLVDSPELLKSIMNGNGHVEAAS